MYVKILGNLNHDGQAYEPGSFAEISEGAVPALIADGIVEMAEQPAIDEKDQVEDLSSQDVAGDEQSDEAAPAAKPKRGRK